MGYKKNPCRDCWQAVCPQTQCPRWQVWFLESWQEVNRFAWLQVDRQGRTEPEKFRYELPHMVRSPCADCPCEKWCDTPCSLRLKWWDIRMDRLRKGGFAWEKKRRIGAKRECCGNMPG